MRKSLLFLLIFTGMRFAAAQHKNDEMSVSLPFNINTNEIALKQLSYDTLGIISVSGLVPYVFTFDLFSNDLKLKDTKKADLKEILDKGLSMHNFLQFKNHTYLFLCNYQEKTRSEGITALEFFPEYLEFAEAPKDLFITAKKIRPQSLYPGMNQGRAADEKVPLSQYSASHGLFVSRDRKKFMCTYGLTETDNKEGFEREKIGLHVFDQDLNKLWGGEYTIPHAKDKVEILGHVLGNDGKVYLLLKVYNRSIKRSQADGKPDFHHEIIVYEKGEPAALSISLGTEDYFTLEHRFFEAPGDQLIFGGTFSDKEAAGMQGVFIKGISIAKDAYGKIVTQKYLNPFERISLQSASQPKEGKVEPENLELREVHMRNDGTVDVTLEEYTVYLKSEKFNSRAGNIYILHMDAGGQLAWVAQVIKHQETPSRAGYQLSFSSILSGDDLHLFFYDHPDNFSLQNGQVPAVYRAGTSGELVGVRIAKNGAVEKYIINSTGMNAMGIRYFNEAGKQLMLRVETEGQQGRMVMLRLN